ncbi:MAG: 4-(cytidine 5'-diphospho)-2-C-methyl-D-erythritol kinase [Candidatus Eisenbacteria bacterium]|nr:4-(cytidine 5'-diphospho)-2-C-methyl-D-erythritol kinase [Candidatus Eisenbacteria bacterium]
MDDQHRALGGGDPGDSLPALILDQVAGAVTYSYLAHAKFNLYLAVLGKRADGFHEVDTLLQSLALSDRLDLTPRADGRLTVVADAADVPDGEANLVWRALALLRRRSGVERGLRVEITKRSPARAGLGGGSADAACALCAANRIWGADLREEALEALAAEIGSDVPFFVRGGTQRCRGRGERVSRVPDLPRTKWVIVKPRGDLATADVYARVTPSLTTSSAKSTILLEALAKHDVSQVVASVFNDLEAPAEEILPEAALVRAWMGQLGLSDRVMAGSGSAWVGHCRHDSVAARAVTEGRRRGWRVFVTETVARGWSEAKHGSPQRRSTGM